MENLERDKIMGKKDKDRDRVHYLGWLEIKGIKDPNQAVWVEQEIDFILAKESGNINKRLHKGFKRYMRRYCVYKNSSKKNQDFFKRANDIYEGINGKG